MTYSHMIADEQVATRMADYLLALLPVPVDDRERLIHSLYMYLRDSDCPVWAHTFGFHPQDHEEDF